MGNWEDIIVKVKNNNIRVSEYRPTPLEKLQNLGRGMRTRKRLEEEKVGVPKYNELQKKRIEEEAFKLFGIKRNEK